MTAEPSKLRDELTKLIRVRLPNGVEGIMVEPSTSSDGTEFLLVTIKLSVAGWDNEALETLLEEIETEVAKCDHRYPSVRFQDAA